MNERKAPVEKKRWNRKRIVRLSIVFIVALFFLMGALKLLKRKDIDDLYGAYPDEADLKDPAVVDVNAPKPNVIIVYMDDLGYGDLGCFGSGAIHTPNIDKMADEGAIFTNYHSVASVCAPSRAGLLTGRYPFRTGVIGNPYPADEPFVNKAQKKAANLLLEMGIADLDEAYVAEGLSQKEITIAKALKAAGYRTKMIGKWHLGDYGKKEYYNPLNYGFDSYLGVPYSNDMIPYPLYRDREERIANLRGEAQAMLTGLFTDEAIEFIEKSKEEPFFLYLAHPFPHQPLHASENFQQVSKGGLYGDVVEELDWNIGRLLDFLEESGLEEDTLIVLTSDNGPWYEGSAGGLRGRKGEVYGGGFRVPFIARYPGKIPGGLVMDTAIASIDLFPTILSLAGVGIPEDRVIDGKDVFDNLTGASAKSPHDALYFYHYTELQGILSGGFKYVERMNRYTWPVPLTTAYIPMEVFQAKIALGDIFPLLYDMELDPGEAYNVIQTYPDIAEGHARMMKEWEARVAENPRGFAAAAQNRAVE